MEGETRRILKFSKYHGEGNDMIVLNGIEHGVNLTIDERRRICDRKYGIGADGIIVLGYRGENLHLDYYMANGVEGSLCGNGCRCGLAFLRRLGLLRNGDVTFTAYDGEHYGRYVPETDTFGVTFRNIAFNEIIKIDDQNYFVDNGSPHHVRFVNNLIGYDVVKNGRELRYGTYAGINGSHINFVQTDDSDNICARTYERGVEDETNACGTGAVAVAIVTAFRTTYTNEKEPSGKLLSTEVNMGTGKLTVNFMMKQDLFFKVELLGKAVHVFDGKYVIA